MDKYFHCPRVRPGIRMLQQEHELRDDLVLIPGDCFPDYMIAAVYNRLDLFSQLLKFLGIPLPSDWRQRVIAGANPNISGTFSANLGIDGDRRDHLSDAEKLLFSVVAPTLRQALGYDEA